MVDRVYALGLSYLQQAIQARIQGDESASASFQSKFFSLCETVKIDGINAAAHTVEDDTFEVLKAINDGRLELLASSERATDASSLTQLRSALRLSTASCHHICQALMRGAPPPAVEAQLCFFSRPIVNEDVPEGHVVIQVHRLSAKAVSGRQFQLLICGPLDLHRDSPVATQWFERDEELNFSTTMKAMTKNPARTLKRRFLFQLLGRIRRMLGKPKDPEVLAALELPVSILAASVSVSRDFQLELAPDSPQDEQFVLSLALKARMAFGSGVFEQGSIEYECCQLKPGSLPPPPKAEAPARKTQPPAAAKGQAQPAH
jgi:hypothetical protein